MATEEIEVVVAPDGTVTVHVIGIEGTACLTATEELVAVLGGEIESQELTNEAFIQVEEQQDDRLRH